MKIRGDVGDGFCQFHAREKGDLTMYRSFVVRNFRCFQELELKDLARVNLIVGANNAGKTALLEALFLHCGTYNPELALRLNAFRGIETLKVEWGWWAETPWDSLFYQFDTAKTIELIGEDTATGRRSLRLKVLRELNELARVVQVIRGKPIDAQRAVDLRESLKTPLASEMVKVLQLECQQNEHHSSHYLVLDPAGVHVVPIPPSPPFPAFFLGARMRMPFREEAERFGRLELEGKQDKVLEVLKLIEPNLRRLTVVVVGGEPMLHGDIGIDRLMPLPVMGEGMVRLASLVTHIGNAANGVVLVDEIENGLHYSILLKVWRVIGKVAQQFNTQIFATTHSLECIVAAHRAFSESEDYDFRLHRLERVDKETICAVTYDQKTLDAAIETGLEVR